MTNILRLPEVAFDWTIERDSDIVESLGYYDPAGLSVDLTGITHVLTVRKSLTGPVVYQGSTLNGDIQLLQTSAADPNLNAWAWVVYAAQFPAFLTVGTYFHNMQVVADGRKRTTSSGNLRVVTRGAN